MNVKKFVNIFKEKVKYLYGNDGLGSSIENTKELKNHGHTYLINIAIYITTEEYNNKDSSVKLFIVPEEGGKGRMPTDFLLINKSGKKELLIEHENSKRNAEKNFQKLEKKDAKEKLLICYVYENDDIEKRFDDIKKWKKDEKCVIHVLIARKIKKEKYRIFNSQSTKYKYHLL